MAASLEDRKDPLVFLKLTLGPPSPETIALLFDQLNENGRSPMIKKKGSVKPPLVW